MDKIDELLTRGVDKIYPSREDLEKILQSGKKLKLYQGFDPTGKQLHIGHMMGLRKLKQFQDAGHEVIFLIGDFTAMIGDPSGKTSARKILTHEEVLENAKLYKEQAGRILRFEGKNAVKILHNGDWLGKLSAIEFLKLSHNLTVSQVIERDMFQKRMEKEQDVFMNEFLYPVMQAYDSVAMDVDLEIGGSDQMFNMMMGRKLMRNIKQKEKYVLTLPLLTDSQGNKIGKTEGNVMALDDDPPILFGKIMSLSDDIIVKGLEYLTDLPMSEVREIDKKLSDGGNPIEFKKKLAFEIVKQLSNKENAEKAQAHFEKTVQNKEMPENIKTISLSDKDQYIKQLSESLVQLELAPSKSEARRLIAQGGVSVNEEKITDPTFIVNPKDGMIIKVGKRNYIRFEK